MKTKILLFCLILLAFVLRFYTLPQNLFYAFEQGRDLEVIKSIVVNHKFTLIGPRTSIEGIFHGSLYYYLAVLPFILSHGSPVGIMALFILWQSLGILFIYKFIGVAVNKLTSLTASILYATSYGLIFYSRWFSHPPLIIPFSLLLFWSLWKVIKDKIYYLLLALSWVAIFHLDLVVAISFLPAIFLYFVWQKPQKPTTGIAIGIFLALFVLFIPYILFDLRHNFLMVNSLIKFISINKQSFPDMMKAFSHFWFRTSSEIQDILAPNFPLPALLIFFSAFLWLVGKRHKNALEKLLMLWMLSIPTWGIFVSPFFGLKHYLVGLGAGIVILIAYWLNHLWQGKWKIVAIAILLALLSNNLCLVKDWLPKQRDIFYLFSQPQMILSNEKNVVDYVYSDAQRKNFGWEAFTLPYWSVSGWQYLFSWYGAKKYGYAPKELRKGDIFYVIIEPGGDKLFLDNWLKDKMDERGKVVEEKNFGGIRVQKRDTML